MATQASEVSTRPVQSLAIAARLTLAAHALNNEGSRNNALIPRQVDVVQDGQVVQTNAVSGDSVKHTFVDHLRALALDPSTGGVALCGPCREGNPNRLNADPEFQEFARSKATTAEVLDKLLERCALDDVAGLLVTQGNRNAPRRTTAQFGWMIGSPDTTRTGRYIHLKLVPGAPSVEGEAGSNLGQNLFTRPASSGQYAFIASLDLARIGVNDVSWQPSVEFDERRHRARLAVEAAFLTLANPGGAQRNTQLPHLEAAEGAICISRSLLPPALCSPLREGYVEQMEGIARAFDHGRDQLEVVSFATISEAGGILAEIANGPLLEE